MTVLNTSSGSGKRPIKVLVVDDSPTAREFLAYLFASDPEFAVVGTASNGAEALAAVKAMKPDVVTMDIHMPKMSGYEATRAIMESNPVPIVIVTGSLTDSEIDAPFTALESGALAVVRRPEGLLQPQHAAAARELIQTVKLMSEVKVVRRWTARKTSIPDAEIPRMQELPEANGNVQLVAIGASTGGPLALQQIFSLLPKDFPAPIIVVQHITDGFAEGFSNWLAETSHFPVHMAADGETLQPGNAYIVPNGKQVDIDGHGRVLLKAGNPENGHLPSVSGLFRSIAASYGSSAVGVLLTGMGKDGASELGQMKRKGSVTLVQDKDSSVVHGMPGEAIKQGAASYVLSPERIAAALIAMTRG